MFNQHLSYQFMGNLCCLNSGSINSIYWWFSWLSKRLD